MEPQYKLLVSAAIDYAAERRALFYLLWTVISFEVQKSFNLALYDARTLVVQYTVRASTVQYSKLQYTVLYSMYVYTVQ